MYTTTLSSRTSQTEGGSWFVEGTGRVEPLVLHPRDGFLLITNSWFLKRGFTEEAINALDHDQIIRRVRAAYPSCITITYRSARDGEVLHDHVVNRNRFLNDLIMRTWSEGWFLERGIAQGEATDETLTDDEFDRLICEAYPDYAEHYMQHDSRVTFKERMKRIGPASEALDYIHGEECQFAKLPKSA